jgi:hypothetical protein
LFANERIVSVDLAGKSRPATREIFQSLGFSLTLRQFHQATTFSRVIYAMLCAIHEIIPRSASQYPKKQDRKKNDDSTDHPVNIIPLGYPKIARLCSLRGNPRRQIRGEVMNKLGRREIQLMGLQLPYGHHLFAEENSGRRHPAKSGRQVGTIVRIKLLE